MAAPMASSARKETAPRAVLATRNSDQWRRARGVKRSEKSSMVSSATQVLYSRRMRKIFWAGAAAVGGSDIRGRQHAKNIPCGGAAPGALAAQGPGGPARRSAALAQLAFQFQHALLERVFG